MYRHTARDTLPKNAGMSKCPALLLRQLQVCHHRCALVSQKGQPFQHTCLNVTSTKNSPQAKHAETDPPPWHTYDFTLPTAWLPLFRWWPLRSHPWQLRGEAGFCADTSVCENKQRLSHVLWEPFVKSSFCESLWPATQQQNMLSSPWCGVLKADFPSCALLRRSRSSQNPVSHIYIYICTYIHTHMCVCTYVCMYVCNMPIS